MPNGHPGCIVATAAYQDPAEPAGSSLFTIIRQRSYHVLTRRGVLFACFCPESQTTPPAAKP